MKPSKIREMSAVELENELALCESEISAMSSELKL